MINKMPKNPPFCYICNESCDDNIEDCVYCICDITICPNCPTEHEIDSSKLIRT